jgi:hypothetical protein
MAEATQTMKIDRLTLNLPSMSPAAARQVGELVAAGLAAAGTLPQAGDIPRLAVTLEARTESPETLARRIVAETLLALRREG